MIFTRPRRSSITLEGLIVPMDDALLVRFLKSFGHLGSDVQSLFEW